MSAVDYEHIKELSPWIPSSEDRHVPYGLEDKIKEIVDVVNAIIAEMKKTGSITVTVNTINPNVFRSEIDKHWGNYNI